MSMIDRPIYPFSAIVAQERLKRALLLNAVNPRVGGVLIRGEKGTAKSTAVRALARLLPIQRVVADCPYSDPPDDPQRMCNRCRSRWENGEELPVAERPTRLIELPVNASEDRVVGSLDLEHALAEGERRFEPGLLAAANRGVLYVDEVNLLDDHLVDLLLDAAAMGVNTVEREGISVSHPARFILVGTMNPEEGELRPQLLDRFGLVVEIGGLREVADRVAIIQRRLDYEADPVSFAETWAPAEHLIQSRIREARTLLPSVQLTTFDMAIIARLAIEMGVDGHRADLAILEAARTHAALEGRLSLAPEDIRVAAELALPHRLRRQPFVDVQIDDDKLNSILQREADQAAQQGVEKKKS
ncbi:MAG: ATP-binding protein [Herpetosiphonaceae bacterium]|nr:ATP-binding protein [Herpetosiphonaceae bacterium]